MDNSIIIALISGGLAFLGTVVSNLFTHSKTIYRLEQLEKKQDKHNQVIERVYNLEKCIDVIDERQKNVGDRLKDVEREIENGR